MAPVQLRCDIDACGMSWSVSSAARMKASVEDHRRKFHPGWVQPEPKPMTAYRLDYSTRARQF